MKSEDDYEETEDSPDGGDSSENEWPNTPGPAVSKRVITKSKLIQLTKEV